MASCPRLTVVISAYMIAVGAATVFVLIPATMLFGGASLLATSAVEAWGAYVPLLGLTGFALGLGWTLPSIGSQTVVDPSRAGEAAGVNLTVIVTIAGVAVALAGTLIAWRRGHDRHRRRYPGGGPARLAAVLGRGRRSLGHRTDRPQYPSGL